MKNKIIYFVLGIVIFNYSFNANSILPNINEYNNIIKTKSVNGRKQLEKYKEIYGSHVEKHNGHKEFYFTTDVEGLELPLSWAYANAYARLKEFQQKKPSIAETLGCLPTDALERLFNEHVQDSSVPLSIKKFHDCVYDLVDLMDLCFHNKSEHVWKKTVDKVLLRKNNTSEKIFFSPVFLKKQGISIETINFGYFASGPYLSVVEIGPKRNAHNQQYSQTNRRFIINHDKVHNNDTINKLTKYKIFDLFQDFYYYIDAFAEKNTKNYDILQLGFFLLTHEHINIWECCTHIAELSLLDVLDSGINELIDLLAGNFLPSGSDLLSFNLDNYVVLYKDSFDGIINIIKKHEIQKSVDIDLSPTNRSFKEFEKLNLFLSEFKRKFMVAAKYVCAMGDLMKPD